MPLALALSCKRIGTLALLAAALATTAAPAAYARPLSDEPHRFLYQVYVRAFWDGSPSPDGEGDFAGLAAKADYLAELGVDAVLLMPVFASTGDMGYIPRDYFQADRGYGDLDAFKRMADALHARGIKIILDAPLNHIAWDSEWFLRASQRRCDPSDPGHDPNDPGNEFCDYFYFAADPCRSWPYASWHKPWKYDTTDCTAVWFQRPEFNPAYHRSEAFYATFFSVMPDLKFWDFERRGWNEPVVRRLESFFDRWSSLGADGFRIDAAKHFVEGDDGNNDPREPRNLELLARFLAAARRANPDTSFIGEIWSGHDQFEPYVERTPQALDMVLDFPFMEAVRASVGGNHGERVKGVLSHFAARQNVIANGARVVFSGNHDVTRLMSEWGDFLPKARLAHFLTFSTPATPLVYYGEEIGMHGRVKRPDDTNDDEWVRTINAFPWQGDATSGFPGDVVPVTTSVDNVLERNLEAARADPTSTWHLVKTLAALRKEFGVTPATRLFVRQDLYGHVIGWTMSRTSEGVTRCRTALVNFDHSNTYTISAYHAVAGCGTAAREKFSERARRTSSADGVAYELGPYAMVLVDD